MSPSLGLNQHRLPRAHGEAALVQRRQKHSRRLYHSLIHARALVKIVLSKFAQLLGQKGQDLTQSAWFRAAVPSQLGAEAHGLGDRTGRAHR